MTYESVGKWVGARVSDSDGDWKNDDEETLRDIMKKIVDADAKSQYKAGMKAAIDIDPNDEALGEFQTKVGDFIKEEQEDYQGTIFGKIESAKTKADLDKIDIDDEYMSDTIDELKSAIKTKAEELESEDLDELEKDYRNEINKATSIKELRAIDWDDAMEDSDQRTRIAQLYRDKAEDLYDIEEVEELK